ASAPSLPYNFPKVSPSNLPWNFREVRRAADVNREPSTSDYPCNFPNVITRNRPGNLEDRSRPAVNRCRTQSDNLLPDRDRFFGLFVHKDFGRDRWFGQSVRIAR